MKNNKGIALLMMLIMISFLAGTIMICAFAMGHKVNDDWCYAITLQRMSKIKRALIGRLADVPGGLDITSCGGFISDYGELDNPDIFGIDNLLSTTGLTARDYNNIYKFWAGYQEEPYLIPPAGETDFRDGWGYPLEISFNSDKIEIRSRGSDGPSGTETALDYRQDIIEQFSWKRDIEVTIENNSSNVIDVRLIYPEKGIVKQVPVISSLTAGSIDTKTVFDIPVGLRKIEILEGAAIKQVKMLCLSSGGGVYTMEQIDYP